MQIDISKLGKGNLNRIYNQQSGSNQSNLQVNQIITATITEKTEHKLTLTTKNKLSFEAESATINGEVGDELTFKVIKNDKDGLKLRQILVNEGTTKSRKQITRQGEILTLFKKANFVKGDGKESGLKAGMDASGEEVQALSEEQSEAEAEALALARAKNSLSQLSNGTTQSAVRELVASGLSLNKISIDMLSKLVLAIEKSSGEQLPLSDKNAKQVSKALRQLNEAMPLNDTQISYLLKENKTLSVDSIYRSQFSVSGTKRTSSKQSEGAEKGSAKAEEPEFSDYSDAVSLSHSQEEAKAISNQVWKELKGKAKEIYRREGISLNHLDTARFLIDNEIPITKNNVYKAELLKKPLDTEKLIRQLSLLIRENKDIYKAELFEGELQNVAPSVNPEQLEKTYDSLLKELPKIDTQRILFLQNHNRPITLFNLRNAGTAGAAGIGGATGTMGAGNIAGTAGAASVSERGQVNLDTDKAGKLQESKLYLEEIRLKLSTEAAQRLIGKKINIDTMPLREAVEHLRALDKEKYESALRSVSAPVTEANVDKMSSLYDRLTKINPLTNNVFGNLLLKRSDFTINAIHEQVALARSQTAISDLTRAESAYEAFQTVPTAKFGDTFQKVSGQFGDLLQKLSIESSDENIRAATILSKNQIDITEEALYELRMIDNKINQIHNRLHPAIAANMVKEGLVPSEMHVDSLLDYVSQFEETFGQDNADKIAAQIYEMDKNKSLDSETRESVISIYRMLNQIQSDGAASLGLTLKTQLPLTLNNLFEASKHLGKTKGASSRLDINIDKNFGLLEETKRSDIRQAMEKIKEKYTDQRPVTEEEKALLQDSNLQPSIENLQLLAQQPSNKTELLKLSVAKSELDRLISKLTAPNGEKGLEELKGDFMNQPLSSILQSFSETENNHPAAAERAQQDQAKAFLQQLNSLQSYPDEALTWLQERNMPMSMKNLLLAKERANDEHLLSKGLSALGTDLDSVMDAELKDLVEGKSPAEVNQGLLDNLSQVDLKVGDYQKLEQVRGLLQAEARNADPSKLSLPVKLKAGLSTLNMLVLKQKREPSVFMSLDTKALGTVQMFFKTKDQSLDLQISIEKGEALLEGKLQELKENIQDLGLKPDIKILVGNQDSGSATSGANVAKAANAEEELDTKADEKQENRAFSVQGKRFYELVSTLVKSVDLE